MEIGCRTESTPTTSRQLRRLRRLRRCLGWLLTTAYSAGENRIRIRMMVKHGPDGPGRIIRQERSRKTYNALIATGFELLATRELEAITISELAARAGYSVGAFYSRFHSKDEFFDALLRRHLEERTEVRTRIFETAGDDNLIFALMEDLVRVYWTRRRFWRAALIRSIRDPDFWEPVRRHGHQFANRFIARIELRTGRTMTDDDETRVRFAFQVALALINNAIINRPGPIFLGQDEFIDNVVRAFRLVSSYDALISARAVE
jgi:AcrR family transcriptional regulator